MDQLTRSEEALNEANEELPGLEEEYANAEYQLGLSANVRSEYEAAKAHFDEVKQRYESMQTKQNIAGG